MPTLELVARPAPPVAACGTLARCAHRWLGGVAVILTVLPLSAGIAKADGGWGGGATAAADGAATVTSDSTAAGGSGFSGAAGENGIQIRTTGGTRYNPAVGTGGGGGAAGGGAGGRGGTITFGGFIMGGAGGAGGTALNKDGANGVSGGTGSASNGSFLRAGNGGGGGGYHGNGPGMDVVVNTGIMAGGNGGSGGGSTNSLSETAPYNQFAERNAGGGGAGGYGAVIIAGGVADSSNTGSIVGGRGGIAPSSYAGRYGARDGDGGIGVHSASNRNFVNSGTITGGSVFHPGAGIGYVTGNGGTGGDGFVAVIGGFQLSNTGGGSITGGNGGTAIANGAGGAGVSGLNLTIVNAGAITGGIAGINTGGTNAAGGAGVTGSNLTVINSGTVSGGLYSDGTTQAYAIDFTGGANTLRLAGGSFSGNVAVGSGANVAFDEADVQTMSTVITGAGSISHTGTGTLTLTGANTYSGGTTISAGRLAVNGSIASSSGVIVNGGSLGGTGTVTATTINSGGTLAPGNSIGTINVNGNLTFNAGSVYAVELSPADSDRTFVSGTANLSGGSVSAQFAPGSYAARQYTILTAAGLGGTTFAGASSNMANFRTTLSYDATNVYLNLTLSFAGAARGGLNGNQQNVANVLTDYFNRTGGIASIYTGLDANGLSQAAGEPGAATGQAGINAAAQFTGAVFDGAFTDNSDQGGASGYAAKPRLSREAEATYAAITPRDRVASVDALWSVWASTYGGNSRINGDTDAGSSTTSNRVFGTVAGATYRLLPQTQLGFALGGAGSSFSLDGGFGGGKADIFNAAIYGKHNVGAAYIAGLLGYSWQDTTTDRNVVGEQLHASFKAQALSARLEGGWRYATPSLGITPYAALQTTTFYLPAYGETATAGPGIFALNYQSKTITATRGELGAKFEKAMLVQGGIFTLKAKAAWAHDWNTDRVATATFQRLPGATFTVNGAQPSANAALLSLGGEMKWHNGWTLAANIDGEFSRTTASYAGKGNIKYAW